MARYLKEQAEKIKKGLEATTGKEYQVIEYWGKPDTYYVRKKPTSINIKKKCNDL